jgi:hypothetical protein
VDVQVPGASEPLLGLGLFVQLLEEAVAAPLWCCNPDDGGVAEEAMRCHNRQSRCVPQPVAYGAVSCRCSISLVLPCVDSCISAQWSINAF